MYHAVNFIVRNRSLKSPSPGTLVTLGKYSVPFYDPIKIRLHSDRRPTFIGNQESFEHPVVCPHPTTRSWPEEVVIVVLIVFITLYIRSPTAAIAEIARQCEVAWVGFELQTGTMVAREQLTVSAKNMYWISLTAHSPLHEVSNCTHSETTGARLGMLSIRK
jgi:hypothetical protein